ncbi:uncharacterized protein BX664DRAFT_332514 [Halteromyces radiatus]|uniref:uncharacterized protein n=1 Tax=Halteromyces radiatus TaxID=101107 RepID=UPI00221FBAC9|nr:uncharacterized protein BX664DRAFT_332514 [Halteromyces radiatus]KAI8089243.1 hypothetical protein BX664DRAFT_332514 [Halteromyces radiatus]
MSQPIKVGIIGTGIFAYRHLRAYLTNGQDKFQIVACANRSREKAEKFAKEAGIPESAIYTDPKELINDPNVELVDALLPVQFNKEIIDAAIAAGKHILFEKPIAANLKDARDIVLAARQTNTVVAIAENWSYHPKVQAVAEFIRNDGIGKIINFTYDSARPYNPNSPYHGTQWRQNPQHPGGYLSDGCVHDMAHLIPILGRIDAVSAFTTKTHKIHVVEDTLATSIRLVNGGVGVANFTFCSAGIKRMVLEVHGTNGTIRLINDNQVELFDIQGKPLDVLQFDRPDAFEDVEGELDNIYKAIRQGASLGVTVEEGYHHLAFVVAALDAADNERVAKVSIVE